MLREKRRHSNFKPNRRLDAKSSRGMIYENEELRLRTININAEVEKGQSDIKKLKKENEQLRREIWTLRDEYDKLERNLHSRHDPDNMDDRSSCWSVHSKHDSDCSCGSCLDLDTFPANLPDIPMMMNNNISMGGMGSGFTGNLEEISEEMGQNADRDFDNIMLDMQAGSMNMEELSNVPPLKHFENLPYEDIGPNVDDQGKVVYSQKYDPPQIVPRNNNNLPEQDNLQTFSERIDTPVTERASSEESSHEPDLCVSSNPFDQNVITTSNEPLYALVLKKSLSKSSNFQNGGNLDDLLLDIEALTSDLTLMQTENDKSNLNNNKSNSKQYRSELNLFLINPVDKKPTLSASSYGENNEPIYENTLLSTSVVDQPQNTLIKFEENHVEIMTPNGDVKKKSNRASVSFNNNKQYEDNKNDAIIIGNNLLQHNGIQQHTSGRRHSTACNNRKMSVDSVKSANRRKCSHSDVHHHENNRRPSASDVNSSFDESRESSIVRRSSTASKNIPWFGCWGTGCF